MSSSEEKKKQQQNSPCCFVSRSNKRVRNGLEQAVSHWQEKQINRLHYMEKRISFCNTSLSMVYAFPFWMVTRDAETEIKVYCKNPQFLYPLKLHDSLTNRTYTKKEWWLVRHGPINQQQLITESATAGSFAEAAFEHSRTVFWQTTGTALSAFIPSSDSISSFACSSQLSPFMGQANRIVSHHLASSCNIESKQQALSA